MILHWACAGLLLAACLAPLEAAGRTIGLIFDDSGSMKDNIQLPTFGVQLLVATLDGREGHDRLFSIRLSQFNDAFARTRSIRLGGQVSQMKDFGMVPGEIRPENLDRIFQSVQPGKTLITTHDLRTDAEIKSTIAQISRDWPHAVSDTPYEPVELMLDKLARETRDGEEAYLIVVTDGAFYDGYPGMVPSPAVLRTSYETYKKRMKGPLTVLFLFMDGNVIFSGFTKTQAEIAKDQKIYTTLMEVFGGDPNENAPFVRNFEELKEHLVRFIAKISATEVDRRGAVTRRDGNAIELDLPFSVTRIISIATGPDSAPPPRATSTSFKPAGKLDFQPMMAKGDNAEGKLPNWPKTRLVGHVTQFRMEPALGPGRHRVEFTGPATDTVLLFRTEVGLRVKLVDEGGREVSADSRGAVEVARSRRYKVIVQIEDRVPGAGIIQPSRLRDAVITGTMSGPAGTRRSITLTPSDADGGFIGEIVFDSEGRHGLDTVFRQPGFVTSRSDPVAVTVIDRASNIALRLQRVEACPSDCPQDAVPVTVRPGSTSSVVAHLEVTGSPPPRKAGRFRLDLDNLEPGFEIHDMDGKTVKPGTAYPLESGRTLRFDVVRQAGWRPRHRVLSSAPKITVKAVALQPLEGEAAVSFRILPILPDLILKYRGHDQDPTGTRPLAAQIPDLERARQAFDFYVENALDLPKPSNIAVRFENSLAGMLAAADLRIPLARDDGPSGYAFAVHPRVPWYCQCFLGTALVLGIASSDVPVKVTYDAQDGRVPATAEAPLRFDDDTWRFFAFWSGCTWLLISVILLAYILWVLRLFIFAAHRFPREARFYIFEFGYTDPTVKAVRNSLWSDLWSSLRLRVPRHHYRIDGLIVEADAGQLRMRTRSVEWPNYRYVRRGMLLQEVAEEMAKRKQVTRASDAIIPTPWNSIIEEPVEGGRRIVFVRNYAHRPQAAITREVMV